MEEFLELGFEEGVGRESSSYADKSMAVRGSFAAMRSSSRACRGVVVVEGREGRDGWSTDGGEEASSESIRDWAAARWAGVGSVSM